MEDFKSIFERMDIKQLCAFLLCGADDPETDRRDYGQKIKEESKPLFRRLENLYPDGEERDDFFSDILQALVAHEQVYMEMGMKAGAKLIFQLLQKAE